MSKDVALITLHGMGRRNERYFSELEAGLQRQLGPRWERVAFHPIDYADLLQTPQDHLWRAMISHPQNEMDYTRLRQFMLYGFGDAGSLEHSARKEKSKPEGVYYKVQALIQQTLRNVLHDFDGQVDRPIVIVAHSLGCQVISNYLWDAQHDYHIFAVLAADQSEGADFMRLKTAQNLITTGCNIPLFVAGLEKRICFERPNPKFHWDNYYDPDDILGWPLQQLDQSYAVIVQDHVVEVGRRWASWTPLSHSYYWGDKDIHQAVARSLAVFL